MLANALVVYQWCVDTLADALVGLDSLPLPHIFP